MPVGESSETTQRKSSHRGAVTPDPQPRRRGPGQTAFDAGRNRREGRRRVPSKLITTTQGGRHRGSPPLFEAWPQAVGRRPARFHARRRAPRERRPPVPKRAPGIDGALLFAPNDRGALAGGGVSRGDENAPPSSRMAGRNRSPYTARRVVGGARRPGTDPRGHDRRGAPGTGRRREAGARAPGAHTK